MIEVTIPGNQGKFFFDNSIGINQFKFETSTTLHILKDVTILSPSLAENVFGIHTFVDVSRDGTARWGQFSKPKHNLRAADATCTWNPTGGLTFGINEITTCKLQYEDEMCAGDLWSTCFQRILGSGMDMHDFFATPEGTAFVQNATNETMTQIRNDVFDIYYFAGHPAITTADDNDFWISAGVDPKDWTAYTAQMLTPNCVGIMTVAEQMKTAQGYPHFNVVIDEADVSGSRYTGDAIALFDLAIAASTPELKAWSLQSGAPNYATPVIMVTPGIFQRYKEQLRTQYNGIPQGFQLMLESETGIGMPMRNVLQYDGYWVWARPEWSQLDAMTGITTHIIMMAAPGVLGLAFDVPLTEQNNGMGLVVTQRLFAPFKGKVYFESLFRAGGLILDHRFLTYGSLFLNPENA